jgi:hypothetical protein
VGSPAAPGNDRSHPDRIGSVTMRIASTVVVTTRVGA